MTINTCKAFILYLPVNIKYIKQFYIFFRHSNRSAMFERIFSLLLISTVVLAPWCARSVIAQPDTAWLYLFNGTNLNEWDGDPSVWRVQDGYISGGQTQTETTFMWYRPRTFDDFVLKLKVWLVDNYGNAGIQYRSEVIDPQTWMVMGYQADVGPDIWGDLYDEHRRNRVLDSTSQECLDAVKANDWNDYRVEADSFTLRHYINGIQCADYTDEDETNRSHEGIIAIQVHSPGDFEVRYDSIRIVPLNEGFITATAYFNQWDANLSNPDTLINPFYNVLGQRIPAIKSIWQRLYSRPEIRAAGIINDDRH
jgi:hypothetical protein